MTVSNLEKRLSEQLDGLVVFMAASHEAVFDLIRTHESDWLDALGADDAVTIFEQYHKNVIHGAFLLGFAYFEAFLADLARAVLATRPTMLPRQRQPTAGEVIDAGRYEALLNQLVDAEVRSVFFKAIEDQRSYFLQKLSLEWPDEPQLVVAARIRNCLMHNNGIAETRLADVSRHGVGEPIILSAADVHEYGLVARRIAPAIWQSAKERHLS